MKRKSFREFGLQTARRKKSLNRGGCSAERYSFPPANVIGQIASEGAASQSLDGLTHVLNSLLWAETAADMHHISVSAHARVLGKCASSDSNYAVCPCQLLPAPAVQPKQWASR